MQISGPHSRFSDPVGPRGAWESAFPMYSAMSALPFSLIGLTSWEVPPLLFHLDNISSFHPENTALRQML